MLINSYQYYLTGALLYYNDTSGVNFYGASYLNPNTANQNIVEIVGMNNSTIAFISIPNTTSNTTINDNAAFIVFDNENSTFYGQVDIANLFLQGSDIVENDPVLITGNGTSISITPNISVNPYQNETEIGSYGSDIQYIPNYGFYIESYNLTDNNNYIVMKTDVLVAYDSVNNINTLLTFVNIAPNIIQIYLNNNDTYATANQIDNEYISQFLTRYNISDSSIISQYLTTPQLFSYESQLVYESINDGNISYLDLGNRTNFQIAYSGNKICIFGGLLNNSVTDELNIIDSESFVSYVYHTGIYLNNSIIIQLGHLLFVYSGTNLDNSNNTNLYIINLGNLDRPSEIFYNYNYTNLVDITVTSDTGYNLPNYSSYYTAYSPSEEQTYFIGFTETNQTNNADIYRLRLEGITDTSIGNLNNISSINDFSAISTENGDLYLSYIDTNSSFKMYYYNDTSGFYEISDSYFNNIPSIYIDSLVNGLCDNNDNIIITNNTDSIINLFDNLNSTFIFYDVNTSSLPNSSLCPSVDLGIINEPDIVQHIYKQTDTYNLNKFFNNYLNGTNLIDTITEEIYNRLFTTIWRYVTGIEFNWNNINLMYVCYNNLIVYIQSIFIDIMMLVYSEYTDSCQIQNLLSYDKTQIYNNFNYNTFNTMLQQSKNKIVTLSSINGSFPILLVTNSVNIFTGSNIQNRYIGNISPSYGFIVDVNSYGTVLYIQSSNIKIAKSESTSETSSQSYTPTMNSARTFRDLTLGLPGITQIGTRNFDLENKYPLFGELDSITQIGELLNSLNPENYNALVSYPDKPSVLYDILSGLSKVANNVDFTLLYTSLTINNINDIINMFKPIYSRPYIIVPSVEVIDNIGESVALSDSFQLNIIKQLYDTLEINDHIFYYIIQSFTDTEYLSDVNIEQAIATEVINIGMPVNVCEVTAYCQVVVS